MQYYVLFSKVRFSGLNSWESDKTMDGRILAPVMLICVSIIKDALSRWSNEIPKIFNNVLTKEWPDTTKVIFCDVIGHSIEVYSFTLLKTSIKEEHKKFLKNC